MKEQLNHESPSIPFHGSPAVTPDNAAGGSKSGAAVTGLAAPAPAIGATAGAAAGDCGCPTMVSRPGRTPDKPLEDHLLSLMFRPTALIVTLPLPEGERG